VDPNTLIQADMAKNRNAGQLIENDFNTAKLGAFNRQEAALLEFATLLGNPDLAKTDEGRASMASVAALIPGGIKDGPAALTGFSSFTNPNFVEGDADFSRILSGTGVQGWTATPEGQNRDLANNLDVANINAASDLAVANVRGSTPGGGGGSRTPLTVSPAVAAKLSEMLTAALTSQFGDPSKAMDPVFRQDLDNYAAQIFQQNRNAPLAVQQAMQDANLRVDDPWGWWNEKVVGDPLSLAVRAADTTGLGDVMTGPVVAPSTVPGAVPAAPGTSPGAPTVGPNVHTNADGSTFYVAKDGSPQVLVEGYGLQNPADPSQRIIWRGGQWVSG
jgi:hypothetical protein